MSRPQTRSSSCSRLQTRPGFSISVTSSLNSVGPSFSTFSPGRPGGFPGPAGYPHKLQHVHPGSRGPDRRSCARSPRHQLQHRIGLDHIVIGPGFQPADAVDLFGPGRQHDDRDPRVSGASSAAADLDPGDIGHHPVQHDDVGLSSATSNIASSPLSAWTTESPRLRGCRPALRAAPARPRPEEPAAGAVLAMLRPRRGRAQWLSPWARSSSGSAPVTR
jgi:hypothetical protein